MKKTNIRMNDYFLIKKNDQYFLSDITDQDQWINTDNLVNHKGKNITSKLQELTEQYNINYNVDDYYIQLLILDSLFLLIISFYI